MHRLRYFKNFGQSNEYYHLSVSVSIKYSYSNGKYFQFETLDTWLVPSIIHKYLFSHLIHLLRLPNEVLRYSPSTHLATWLVTSQFWAPRHLPTPHGLTHFLFWHACLAGHSLLLRQPTPPATIQFSGGVADVDIMLSAFSIRMC